MNATAIPLETLPAEIDPRPWLDKADQASDREVQAALQAPEVNEAQLAALLSPAAAAYLEPMAQRAQALTRRQFGRTIHLYAPLYLSNYCGSRCTYCGFAAQNKVQRSKLTLEETAAELSALQAQGIEEVLLLTGERTRTADVDYICAHTELAARHMHQVTAEVFPMTETEYRQLVASGCVGISLYQETYDPAQYARCHLGGDKRHYGYRLHGPARALAAGMRTVGLGALLGLADPRFDLLALFRHARWLQRQFWQAGLSLSFPRIQPQTGHFEPPYPISDAQLAQYIFAFRLALPSFPLVLSTREAAAFRDGMAGLGVSKMSVASKTTVGGYAAVQASDAAQFEISDERDVATFCLALRRKHLEPVFKDWDAVYRNTAVADAGRTIPGTERVA